MPDGDGQRCKVARARVSGVLPCLLKLVASRPAAWLRRALAGMIDGSGSIAFTCFGFAFFNRVHRF